MVISALADTLLFFTKARNRVFELEFALAVALIEILCPLPNVKEPVLTMDSEPSNTMNVSGSGMAPPLFVMVNVAVRARAEEHAPTAANIGGTMVLVGVTVGVKVGVLVGVLVGVKVGVKVGVFVGVLVGVAVGTQIVRSAVTFMPASSFTVNINELELELATTSTLSPFFNWKEAVLTAAPALSVTTYV